MAISRSWRGTTFSSLTSPASSLQLVRTRNVSTDSGNKRADYISALSYRWLTRLYDPVVHWTTREMTFKRRLLLQAGITAGHSVLDLGCGTGTLALLVKSAHPAANVVGIDADPEVLEIARAKAALAGLEINLDRGLTYALPYPDSTFNRVLSSLVFHHLSRTDKERTLREVLRVLKPGGEFHLADWGFPQNRLMRWVFFLVQLLDGFTTTGDNVAGLLPILLKRSGLVAATQTASYNTLFGTIRLYMGRKPGH